MPFGKKPVLSGSSSSNFNDYLPQATLLELALLQNDQDRAFEYLSAAKSTPHEVWQTSSTTNNLELYKVQGDWLVEVIQVLIDN
jgi:hypothetical protein